MGWEIKIWHEGAGAAIRVVMDLSPDVPEDVVSAVAGAYWVEEVQFNEESWDENEFSETSPDMPGKIQG